MGMGVVGCVAEACMHCTPKTKGCDKLSGIALQEATRLAQLEDTIQRGLNTFVDVGNALLEEMVMPKC